MPPIAEKLAVLADAAKYDASCASSGAKRSNGPLGAAQGLGDTSSVGICHSYTPDGRCISLLKVLMTNYCVYDCKYCVNRVSSDTKRAIFTPAEVVWLTVEFYKRNYIEGLFLSSGVVQSPDYTMERLAEIARRLREDERFLGYIHLKAVPGASPELLERAGRYADRLSANVELPREDDLRRLAPEKTMTQVELTMSTIRDRHDAARQERKQHTGSAGKTPRPRHQHAESPRARQAAGDWRVFAPAGQSTQMIVGATDATDADILSRATSMYQQHKLRRVYYSAFSPIPHADSRLPGNTPPLIREHRLYQADWLVRFYGFSASELTTPDAPHLDGEVDPKLAWALRNPEFFPVDLNNAPRGAILRVPGIGVRNTNRLLAARRHRKLRVADLKRLRAAWRRAAPFVVLADHKPDDTLLANPQAALRRKTAPRDEQQNLFSAARSARTGEL